MPGPNDPATVAVPQQALHRVMFRRAGLLPTLACVTNPYSCSLAGRSVLSVSGQTIADILRNSTIKVRKVLKPATEILYELSKTLAWHL